MKDFIAITALILSLFNFCIFIYDRMVKINASLFSGNQFDSVVIFNNSSKQIAISYFEIYSSRFKYLTRKKYASTFFDDGEPRKFIIAPHDSNGLKFSDQYSIDGWLKTMQNKNLYIKIFYGGSKTKTLKIK